jgi:glucose/arabinose dehydrogenase
MDINKIVTIMVAIIMLLGIVPPSEAIMSQDAQFKIVTVVKGLRQPWAVDFLPDGSALITLKPGGMVLIRGNTTLPVAGAPQIASVGQGGLLDLLVPDDFEKTGWVYFSYSSGPSGNQQTSVARARLKDWSGPKPRLVGWEGIFTGNNTAKGGGHFGSRLVLSPDGYLFITIGERRQRYEAQNPDNHFGTVVRIYPDGGIPEDNPFTTEQTSPKKGSPDVYSYGHRNAQGAALHPITGDLWIHEHGPKGGDEINIIKPGVNYGWPIITHGREYSGSQVGEGISAKDGMEQPLLHWTPSIAPSGMAFYTADKFPGWQGDLFVGALAGKHLRRVKLGGPHGNQVLGQEVLLKKRLGRIRDVAQGPDGFLYILTDGKRAGLYRLEP